MNDVPKRLKSSKDIKRELAIQLKDKDRVFVLFYATWCGYSRMFLPCFEKLVEKKGLPCLRLTVDENEVLFEKFDVDVMPSVLVFKKGKLFKRLDGLPHLGLDEDQLEKLIESCK